MKKHLLQGIGASEGIAIAKVFEYDSHLPDSVQSTISNVEQELSKFNEAVKIAMAQLERIQAKALITMGEEKAAVFEAHIQVASDPAISDEVKEMVNEDKVNVDYALQVVAKKYQDMFESMEDEYFQERAADIKDVYNRVRGILIGAKTSDLSAIDEEVVIVADDLTPSDTAQLDKKFTKGFITNIGGRTSHAAIMARTLEIPAVLGLGNITNLVESGDIVIIDGTTGVVIVNPSQEEIAEYRTKAEKLQEEHAMLAQLKNSPTITKDGHRVHIEGNIGAPKDVHGVVEHGGEGVGLFRSEFLYMDASNWPTEEEQFVAYKEALENMNGKMVVIRTLDIGGDKTLSYYKFPEEMNPFLGYRAVRLCLDQTDIFKTQLRALIRASKYGKLAIMIPLITTINEFTKAKAIFEECKKEVIAEGHPVSDDIEFGMMVEVPAAAVLAKQFAKHADFFSIGTNDLIQYSHAADRMSQPVSYLYQPCNPSILNLVRMTIEGAHSNKRWVGMCGEMAGTVEAIPLLLGLGLDYFSMSASAMLKARHIINSLNYEECKVLAHKACEMETEEEVLALVRDFMKQNNL